MKFYQTLSLLFAITFAVVGLIFLLFANDVLNFFNSISNYIGMLPSPVQGFNFYLILAVGYMYLVTILAFFMYRFPKNSLFPLLLAHGKLASALLSLGFFLVHQPYLIYITNCLVDAGIGIIALIFYFKLKRISA